MGAWRGATTKLGHRTHRTRALDVGTDPSGFDAMPGYDYKRGIPSAAAPGGYKDPAGEAQDSIKTRGEPAPRKSAGSARGR
jgi:hypothetical protein